MMDHATNSVHSNEPVILTDLMERQNEGADSKGALPGNIIYRSRRMHELVRKAISYARSNATVLITGANGTGKELFAKLIHQSSQRSNQKYCRVNCAALSSSLTESEFFGHEKGAFTGADRERIGRFEWAEGGTLLLDEISEIETSTQAKLLRLLEENELQRVGSNQTIKTDVRVIATSNRNLIEQINQSRFREDLYYRLNVLRLNLPSLGERVEDIPVLANLFLRKFQHESRVPLVGFEKQAMNVLCNYDWPGNIRQLRNVVLSACVVADSEKIKESDLPDLDFPESNEQIPGWLLKATLEEIERRVIIENLNRSNGNKTVVAKTLGVTTRTLSNKVKHYRDCGFLELKAS